MCCARAHEPSPRSGVSAERRWLVVATNCGALPRRRNAGSWPQCAIAKPWRLPMNPLTPSLSPSEGERVVPQSRDRVRGWFIPMHAQKRKEATHNQGARLRRALVSIHWRSGLDGVSPHRSRSQCAADFWRLSAHHAPLFALKPSSLLPIRQPPITVVLIISL